MPSEDGYYQRYYERNKNEINEKRKKRYKVDSEYRQRVLQHSKTYRDKKRKRPDLRMPRFFGAKEYEAGDGGTVRLFSVGAFATFVQRSAQSISHWEKRGMLPPTPYRDSRGHRLYTQDMIESAKAEVGNRRRLFPVDPDMIVRIEAAWIASGVPVGIRGSLDHVLAQTKTITE